MTFKEFKKPILIFISLTLLTVGMIFFVDVNLAINVQDNLNESVKHVFSYITEVGSFPYIFTINLFLLLFFAYMSKFSKNKEQYLDKLNLLIYGACGEIVALAATQSLKYFFGRSRPFNYFNGNAETMFTFFNFEHEYVSFPSGHSSGIWALITCLLFVFKYNKYSRFLIIIGLLISISRIILNMHFLSDVFFGAVLSIFLTKYTALLVSKTNVKIKF